MMKIDLYESNTTIDYIKGHSITQKSSIIIKPTMGTFRIKGNSYYVSGFVGRGKHKIESAISVRKIIEVSIKGQVYKRIDIRRENGTVYLIIDKVDHRDIKLKKLLNSI